MRYATHTEDGRFPKLVQVQEMLYLSLTKKFQYNMYLGSVRNSMRDVHFQSICTVGGVMQRPVFSAIVCMF